jgi:hypothetical protein
MTIRVNGVAAGSSGSSVPAGSSGDVVVLDGSGGELAVAPLAVGAKAVDVVAGTITNTGGATGTKSTGTFLTTFTPGASVGDNSEISCAWPINGITYEVTYRVRHAVSSSGNRVGIIRIDLGDSMAGHWIWIETDEQGNTTAHYDGSGTLAGWSPASPSSTMWVKLTVDGNRVAVQASETGVFRSYFVDNTTTLPTFSLVSAGKISITSIKFSGKQVTSAGSAAATVTFDNISVRPLR